MSDVALETATRIAMVNGIEPRDDPRVFNLRVKTEWWDPWHCLKCGGNGQGTEIRNSHYGTPAGRCNLCTSCKGSGKSNREDQERYKIAAYLGHAGARERVASSCGCLGFDDHMQAGCVVCGSDVEGPDGFCEVGGPLYTSDCKPLCYDADRQGQLVPWLRGLQRWCLDPGFWVAGVVAAGWVAYGEWLLEQGWWLNPGDPPQPWRESGDHLTHTSLSSEAWERDGARVEAPGNAIRAAEAWVACQCKKHKQKCRDANRNLPNGFDRLLYAITDAGSVCANGDPHSFRAIITFSHLASESAVRVTLQDTWLRQVLP